MLDLPEAWAGGPVDKLPAMEHTGMKWRGPVGFTFRGTQQLESGGCGHGLGGVSLSEPALRSPGNSGMAAAAQRSAYFQPVVGWDPRTGSSHGKELGSDSDSPKSVYQRGAGAEGKAPRRQAVTLLP